MLRDALDRTGKAKRRTMLHRSAFLVEQPYLFDTQARSGRYWFRLLRGPLPELGSCGYGVTVKVQGGPHTQRRGLLIDIRLGTMRAALSAARLLRKDPCGLCGRTSVRLGAWQRYPDLCYQCVTSNFGPKGANSGKENPVLGLFLVIPNRPLANRMWRIQNLWRRWFRWEKVTRDSMTPATWR